MTRQATTGVVVSDINGILAPTGIDQVIPASSVNRIIASIHIG